MFAEMFAETLAETLAEVLAEVLPEGWAAPNLCKFSSLVVGARASVRSPVRPSFRGRQPP